MRRFLPDRIGLRLLLGLLVVALAAAPIWPRRPAGGGGGGQCLSDNFDTDTSSNWDLDDDDATFSIDASDDNQISCPGPGNTDCGARYTATELDTISQFASLKFPESNTNMKAACLQFRGGEAGDEDRRYVVCIEDDGSGTYFIQNGTAFADILTSGCELGNTYPDMPDWVAASIEGTADSTVARLWWSEASAFDNDGPSGDSWGGRTCDCGWYGSAASATSCSTANQSDSCTDSSVTCQDSGKQIGIWARTYGSNAHHLDDWFGGDTGTTCP